MFTATASTVSAPESRASWTARVATAEQRLVVPHDRCGHRRQPPPAEHLLRGDLVAGECGRRSLEHGRRRGAALGEQQRETVQQQIGRARRVRRTRAGHYGLRDVEQVPGACQRTGEHGCAERVEIGLTCESRVERLERLCGPEQQRRSVAPAVLEYATSARRRSMRARPSSSSGPASAAASSPSAGSNAPACTFTCAASSVRSARRAGSAVSSAACPKKAAAAARPPRACARPADCSSSTATSSSGPRVAWARCQARRSGSRVASVTSANAPCTLCLSRSDADR